jgi:hypothetical protein
VEDALGAPYLIAAGLALLAAALLLAAARRPAVWAAAAVAAACVAVYAIEKHREAPPPVTLQDPCHPRPVPDSGGLSGLLQQQVLQALNQAACHVGSTREELALALFDRDRAAAFQRKYGIDPRSISGLLSLLGG